ncbi:MAG: acyltransferase family protein [Eubacterium sp.]
MEKERIYYWDNLKALLIFLVVLGHFLIPVSREGKSVESVYFFIYLFHMPAFVFVSGYFAQYYMKKEVPQVNKLIGFLILFLVYKVLLWAVNSVLAGHSVKFDLFSEEAAPWYLLCMFLWYLYLPLFAKFKPVVSIGIAVLFGMLVGLDSSVGIFLSFSRFAVFLPCFLAGYYFNGDMIPKITSAKMRAAAAVFLLATAIAVIFNLDVIDRYETIIYGSHSYAFMDVSGRMAVMLRGIWYMIALAITFGVMCLIPKRKTLVSYIGSRTLTIYIIHRLIRPVFEKYDVYQYFMENGIELLIFCIVISVVITFVFSEKHISKLFQKAFNINYDKLLIHK